MAMLNSTTKFEILNVPEEAILLRFNVLYAYVHEALSHGKGLMLLKIMPGKNRTIASVLHETFLVLKCFDNKKLALISPKTVAYIHALMIDAISIQFKESINAQELDHESSILEAYTEMETNAFTSQLQAVLTFFYQNVKEVTGASCDGNLKSKVVKPRFHNAAPMPVNNFVDVDVPDEAAAAAAAD